MTVSSAQCTTHYVAWEAFRDDYLLPAPEVKESEESQGRSVLALEALVRMELTAHRCVECVNLRDLIDVGLIDETWPACFPPELGARLQALLDDPEG